MAADDNDSGRKRATTTTTTTTHNKVTNDNGHKSNNNNNNNNNSNHKLRSAPSSSLSASSQSSPSLSPSSSSSSSPSSRKLHKRRSITVKTSLNIRPSHVFIAICIIIAAIIPLYIFDSRDQFLASVNAFFFPPILKSGLNANPNTNANTKSSSSSPPPLATDPNQQQNSNSKQGTKLKTKETLGKSSSSLQVHAPGGWRTAEPEILEKYDPQICNVDRVSITDLTTQIFESEYRYKKPVIVTFPNGAWDWTEPPKWTRASLKQEYSRWTVRSGSSVEIVRKGGNGDQASSFTQFLDRLDDVSAGRTADGSLGGSGSYMFDRDFYFQSSLPQTLKLPQFFPARESDSESIFFLGASLSGVVFHKHSDTWNGVVYGRKRWFLYPSTHTPPGGVYNGFSVLDWLSDVYPLIPNGEKPTECVQEGGEILYLPEGWYHATLNLGDTVAFAIQKTLPVSDTEILYYEARDLVNEIQGDALTPHNREIHTRLLQIYTDLNRLLPQSSEAMMKLGEQLHDLGQYSDSLHWFQEAVDRDPFFVIAYLHLGKAYAKLKEYKQAEALLLKALDMSPNLWDVYKEYGAFLMERGRHADALPVFKRGTELMPGLIPFWYFYQQCQIKVGDLEGAEATEEVLADLRNKAMQQ